jgi:HEAT repeat protein
MSDSESSRPSESSPVGEDLVHRLVGLLDDADPAVRRRACGELGGIGPAARDAVPRLVELLSDSHTDVRRTTAVALEKIGRDVPDVVVPRLAELLADRWESNNRAQFYFRNNRTL